MIKYWSLILVFVTACSPKKEVVPSVADQRKQIDSLLQLKLKEMELEHAELLQDRLSIELKLRIDSISKNQVRSRAMQIDSAHLVTDSAMVSNIDSLKHP